jgi:hypothetical protein
MKSKENTYRFEGPGFKTYMAGTASSVVGFPVGMLLAQNKDIILGIFPILAGAAVLCKKYTSEGAYRMVSEEIADRNCRNFINSLGEKETEIPVLSDINEVSEKRNRPLRIADGLEDISLDYYGDDLKMLNFLAEECKADVIVSVKKDGRIKGVPAKFVQ